MIDAVRSLGLAARFVSGYIFVPNTASTNVVGGGSTHAWLQVYLPGAGWVDFDPTNSIIGNRNLIRVAVAWHPASGTAIVGYFHGVPGSALNMQVDVAVTEELVRTRDPRREAWHETALGLQTWPSTTCARPTRYRDLKTPQSNPEPPQSHCVTEANRLLSLSRSFTMFAESRPRTGVLPMTNKPHAVRRRLPLDSATDVNGSSAFMTNWMMRGSRSIATCRRAVAPSLDRRSQSGRALEASGADNRSRARRDAPTCWCDLSRRPVSQRGQPL